MIRTLVGVSRLDMEAAIADAGGDHAGVQVAFLDLAHRDMGAVFDEIVAALRDMALQEARREARALPDKVPHAVRAWWERALRGEAPRPPRHAALEQLVGVFAGVIALDALVLAVDLPVAEPDRAAVMIQAMTRLAGAGVAALFLAPALPKEVPPFDWLAHGAVAFEGLGPAMRVARASGVSLTLLTHGAPASGSAVERRMHQLIMADPELRGQFVFNATMVLNGGAFAARPDLFCEAAGLVVELDGFADHGQRSAFLADRRRDYEFAAAGFLVLRIPNDDVLADAELALEKIRTVMRMRLRLNGGGGR
jgi:very-short-patch-repair endonuclease